MDEASSADGSEPAHSPCSGVCMLDQRFRWCAGCFRKPSEIAEWPHASEARKREILAELDDREARADQVQ